MLALRLAWRQLAAARRRTVVLIVTLAVPTMLLSAWFTLRTSAFEPAEVLTARQFGQTELRLTNPRLPASGDVSTGVVEGTADLVAGLPVDSVVVPTVTGSAVVGQRDVALPVTLIGQDPTPLLADRRLLVDGSPTPAAGEVVLSQSVAQALDAPVGSEVELGGQSAEVVGIELSYDSLDARFAVTPLDTAVALLDGQPAEHASSPTHISWLAAPDPGAEATVALRERGWFVETRSSVLAMLEEARSFDTTRVLIAGISLLALGELALILSAVYALTHQSRIREQALLAAIGVPPRVRSRVARLDGMLVGAAGAVLGLPAGVALARAAMPMAAGLTNQRWQLLQIPHGWLALLLLLTVGTGLTAAGLAHLFVRRDVVALLRGTAGAPPRVPSRARQAVLGATGLGLCVAGALGRLVPLVLIGLLLLLWATARSLERGYVSTGRNSARSVPRLIGCRAVAVRPRRTLAFAAVPLSLILLVGLLAGVLGGFAALDRREHVAQGPEGSILIQSTRPVRGETLETAREVSGGGGVALLSEVVPGPAPLDEAGRPYTAWGRWAVRDQSGAESALHTLPKEQVATWLGRPLSQEEQLAFEGGVVLSLSQDPVVDGEVQLVGPDLTDPDAFEVQTRQVPALAVSDAPAFQGGFPTLVIAPHAVAGLGLAQPNLSVGYIAPGDEPVGDRSEARVRQVVAADVGHDFFMLSVERGPVLAGALAPTVLWAVALLVLATAAITTLMTLLSRIEQRGVFATLSAVGVTRRQRSRVLAWQGLSTSGLGAAAGALVGVVGAVTISRAMTLPANWWGPAALAVAAVLVLLVAWAAGAAAGRLRAPAWREG